ncbi:DNA polymerase/3'-5' exonuclease PolX [Candidatus Woesearchaeota archaeon]|nr:DNA polymerase/3'-5' exonuclease PolX [Candidatus Woesearchaeota archaeon]
MRNFEIAGIFNEMADILEMQDVAWKPNAYRKAARSIETQKEDIELTYKKGKLKALMQIPGVGEGLAKKIEEYIKTGKIHEFEKLKKSIPLGVEEMMHVQGLGPKKAFKLYKKLKIKNLKELEKAAKEGKIKKLEGFGEKSEEDILLGLEIVKRGQERMLLGNALPIARDIIKKLSLLKEIKQIEVAGSVRRKKETVKDIDILVVSSNPKLVMDFFTTMDDVSRILAKGQKKSSVVLKEGLNADVRVIDSKSFGAALQYFTGNKDHNIKLRQIAISKGYKLNEYGLFKQNKYVCGKTEEEIYKKLGVVHVPPEIRQNSGEFDIKKTPELIPYNALKGDLHLHTTWSDGSNSTEEMIKEAIKIKYEYIAITDHSKSQHIANGLDETQLLKHLEEIKKLQKKYQNIKILAGSEVDILKDGSLDYENKYLKQLDFVIASIHSRFKAKKEEMTERMINAMKNKYVHAIGHPSGRLINQRDPYEVDFEKILQAAKDNGIAMEINSYPSRLDLKDAHIKQAVELGVKLVINTDSHSINHLRFIEYGIAQARRGWAAKENIINTQEWKNFEKFLTSRR